ncbi:MAG: hypothetical protein H7320_11645 [Ferruginibacter sp.]|nr:hypothetical protein [Ferruginibacter sp.]
MTHKENCILTCKDYLQNLTLSQYFNMSDFNHYYRKFNGYSCNAYMFGLEIGDFMIQQANNKILNFQTPLQTLNNLSHGTQY